MKYAKIKTYNYGKGGALEYDEKTNDEPYLTENKLYQVINTAGNLFCILMDDGIPHLCKMYGCAHLSGGDWEIIEVNE